MIPINISAITDTDPADVAAVIQSDKEMIGNASPIEIASFITVVIIAYVAGLFVAYYLKRRFSHRIRREHLDFWIRVIRIVLILAALVLTVPPFFNTGLMIVFWILVGLVAVFALAGQKVIANLVAGLALMYGRQFSSGDFVTVGTVTGTVLSVDLFTTTVRNSDGIFVTIPNDQVYNNPISNYHADVARRYVYDIGIRFQDDTPRAISLIADVLDHHTFVLKHPAPEIFVSDITENGVNIRIRIWFPSMWANTRDDATLKTSVLPQLKSALMDAGIEIPITQTMVFFGNDPKTR